MTSRWAWAQVDLAALRRNVEFLVGQVGRGELWATVKANAYGHGAIEVAQVALRAGAVGLCVALADEAHQLRLAGIDCPILIVSEQPPSQHHQMLLDKVCATLYNPTTIYSYANKARELGVIGIVHLKVDTGMHRVGVSPDHALARAQQIIAHESLDLHGVYTHLASADMVPPDLSQLQEFEKVVELLNENAIRPKYIHTANSAATLQKLDLTSDIARVGIAIYGLAPSAELANLAPQLEPVLSLHARVSHVQELAAGQGVSYRWRHKLAHAGTIATLPIGYADGVPRRLWSTGGEVLIRGRRCQIVGAVTMDQLMVDCHDLDISIGDEAVLIGKQGSETITVSDWAKKLETISYEIVCNLSSRLPRRYIDENE